MAPMSIWPPTRLLPVPRHRRPEFIGPRFIALCPHLVILD